MKLSPSKWNSINQVEMGEISTAAYLYLYSHPDVVTDYGLIVDSGRQCVGRFDDLQTASIDRSAGSRSVCVFVAVSIHPSIYPSIYQRLLSLPLPLPAARMCAPAALAALAAEWNRSESRSGIID